MQSVLAKMTRNCCIFPCARFQVWSCWWHRPAWVICCTFKAPGQSALFTSSLGLCPASSTGDSEPPATTEASSTLTAMYLPVEFCICLLWCGQQWYMFPILLLFVYVVGCFVLYCGGGGCKTCCQKVDFCNRQQPYLKSHHCSVRIVSFL